MKEFTYYKLSDPNLVIKAFSGSNARFACSLGVTWFTETCLNWQWWKPRTPIAEV